MESLNSADAGGLRHVSRIAWPIVVSSLSYTAMNAADTFFVASLGVAELAGVGLATLVVFMCGALFVGTLHGTKIVVSQATGAGDSGLADRAGWHGLGIALAFSVPVMLLMCLDGPILTWMGASSAAREAGEAYLAWRLWASAPWFAVIALSDYFQGRGLPKISMRVNLVMNLLNIVLDAWFIFGFGPVPALGVPGAAIATVVSCVVGFVWILWEFVAVARPYDGMQADVVRRIMRFGAPLGVRYLLSNLGFSAFTAVIARLGDDALAAHQIAFRIVSLSFIPGYGVSEAASVLAGQFWGAQRPDLVRRAFLNANVLAVGLMGLCGVAFWWMPEHLFAVFSTDANVAAIGAQLLAVAAFFQVFDAVTMTTFGTLNGVGDTRFSTVASVMGSWFVLVPAAWGFAFALELGVVGAWLGFTLEILALMVAALLRYRTVLGKSAE